MKPRAQTRILVALAVALLVAGIVALTAVEPHERRPFRPGPAPSRKGKPSPPLRTVAVYRGLGAWIDAFDFVPAYHRPPDPPLLVPEDLDALEERGVRTVYIQAARLDPRSPEGIVDRALVGSFLERAREKGMRVVGWYLPKFENIEADLANLRLIRDFEFQGHRFDGVGVDIEFRASEPNHTERNRRLVDLSRRLRQEAGPEALAAIVLAPVLIEVVHPGYWPNFPWSELAGIYDVWLPMTYWTDVPAQSGYREGHRFTAESILRLRSNLGDPSAVVHPIGGVADAAADDDYRGFLRAAEEARAVGVSVYDYRTTSSSGWDILRQAVAG